ncbi:MAG: hypothetical protein ACK521_05590 [bacterium]|jgi:hypothetical protein
MIASQIKKRQQQQKTNQDKQSLLSKEYFPEELVSLNKEILERRLSNNGSFS